MQSLTVGIGRKRVYYRTYETTDRGGQQRDPTGKKNFRSRKHSVTERKKPVSSMAKGPDSNE